MIGYGLHEKLRDYTKEHDLFIYNPNAYKILRIAFESHEDYRDFVNLLISIDIGFNASPTWNAFHFKSVLASADEKPYVYLEVNLTTGRHTRKRMLTTRKDEKKENVEQVFKTKYGIEYFNIIFKKDITDDFLKLML